MNKTLKENQFLCFLQIRHANAEIVVTNSRNEKDIEQNLECLMGRTPCVTHRFVFLSIYYRVVSWTSGESMPIVSPISMELAVRGGRAAPHTLNGSECEVWMVFKK